MSALASDATVDSPNLLDLLDSTGPSSGLDIRSSPAQAYIKRLATLPLNDLRGEPSTIASERITVESELVNLCYREYSTFTSVHRCSSAVGAAFDDFEASLGDLIQSVPSLEQECRQFTKNNSHIQLDRRKAVLLQEHEGKVLDILEIPQLMETCVRNAYYQEALDLASHVEVIKHKVGTRIVQDVVEEVNGVLHLMAAQLLGVLREPVKLPILLKAINFLRRLRSTDDADLGLVFLSSRLHNYRARLVEIEKHRGEPIRYLRRYIDLFREHVFDIISQFTTIFPGPIDDQLVSFACLCVDDLVELVQRYVPRITTDSASMSSILVQLGYCSLSFARVGLDFSAILANPFTAAIQTGFQETVSTAATSFSDVLTGGSIDTTTPAGLLVVAPHLHSILADESSPPSLSKSSDPHVPPTTLAFFPPLAQFLNAHLSSLNALRMLAPLQISTSLLAAQSRSITRASEAILDYLQHAIDIDHAPDLARSNSGTRHSRTGSSPRAHLLRRNTETQLSSETLLARRREAKRVCVAFADAWLHAIALTRNGLYEVLEQTSPTEDHQLKSSVDLLRAWIAAHAEGGAVEEMEGPAQVGVDIDGVSSLDAPSIVDDTTHGPTASLVTSVDTNGTATAIGHPSQGSPAIEGFTEHQHRDTAMPVAQSGSLSNPVVPPETRDTSDVLPVMVVPPDYAALAQSGISEFGGLALGPLPTVTPEIPSHEAPAVTPTHDTEADVDELGEVQPHPDLSDTVGIPLDQADHADRRLSDDRQVLTDTAGVPPVTENEGKHSVAQSPTESATEDTQPADGTLGAVQTANSSPRERPDLLPEDASEEPGEEAGEAQGSSKTSVPEVGTGTLTPTNNGGPTSTTGQKKKKKKKGKK